VAFGKTSTTELVMNRPTQESIAIFDDVKNYVYGDARIIWAETTRTSDGVLRQAGWVLPGGRRTNNIEEVADMAKWINRICLKERWSRQ